MENLEVMVILFIIVILGYVACKLGYMGDKFDKKLSSMVVDITCPLLVLSSVMGDELPDRTLILPLLGVGFLTYILLLVFGFWVPRLITRNHDAMSRLLPGQSLHPPPHRWYVYCQADVGMKL